MNENRLTHRGHDILIRGANDAPEVLVDGEPLPIELVGSRYVTGALPHASFESPHELIRAVIDHSPSYHGRRNRGGA